MKLRESIDDSSQGEGMPDSCTGREDWLYACGLVTGYAEARGIRMAVSTGGGELVLHNLSADTRSAVIRREGLTTTGAVRTAVLAQLDALPFWAPEADDWGADPWDAGTPVRREG